MDVVVKRKNGEINVVNEKELECIDGSKTFVVGKKVRMFYCKKFYFGVVVETENDTVIDNSDDEIPLMQLMKKPKTITSDSDDEVPLSSYSEADDTDEDPTFQPPPCEAKHCTNDGFGTCHKCSSTLCSDHIFIDQGPYCENRHNIPREKKKEENLTKKKEIHPNETTFPFPNSNKNDCDTPGPTTCEANLCKEEIFAACVKCFALLCYTHFVDTGPCENRHIQEKETNELTALKEADLNTPIREDYNKRKTPEDYEVEGAEREEPVNITKKPNKKKDAHQKRLLGLEYESPHSRRVVSAKIMKERCNGELCKKNGRKCYLFSDEERKQLFQAYSNLGDIQLQREYIVRHIVQQETKQKTTKATQSRRNKSNFYHLPKIGEPLPVCRTMFLNTLSITEKSVRTSLAKKEETGIITPDGRGGRVDSYKVQDDARRQAILKHIARFPRVESHYCRKESKREYLHPDLNRRKMVDMFNDEYKDVNIKASYNTYNSILKTQNISFFHPKKDQCSLCRTYKSGDEQKKAEFEKRYNEHTMEKEKVRTIKKYLKEDQNPKKVCTVFDLQQVIYLPKSNDSKIFYSRRLANYNLTVYDIKTKACHCFTWHEGLAKRGSCEISTCLFEYLKELDLQGVEEVDLFSDGCAGQNKNSIIITMLLHGVQVAFKNILRISIFYFEPYHGQNEGDSAHSCISQALDASGELFMPSQLSVIFRLARRSRPYQVHQLETSDVLDFKKVSQDLRVLQVREDDQKNKIDWTKMKQVKIERAEQDKIFFKTSHIQEDYRYIQLKRFTTPKGKDSNQQRKHKFPEKDMSLVRSMVTVPKRYQNPPPISMDKYNDLMALCSGPTPTIKLPEQKQFYEALPH